MFADVSKRAQYIDNMLNYGLDENPDKFTINVNGETINFIFDSITGEILKQKFSDYKITIRRDGYELIGWVVTDPSGNNYYYGLNKQGTRTAIDKDQTLNSYRYQISGVTPLGESDDPITPNTWHLMEIETPHNEKIEFFYREEQIYSRRRSYDKMEKIGGTDALRSYFSWVRTYQNQISRIVFNQGKIVFTPSLQLRKDMEGWTKGDFPTSDALDFPRTLDKVAIFDKQDALLKEYQLQHMYTTSVSNDHIQPYLKNIDSAYYKRLFLSSVQEKGSNGTALPPTTFEYSSIILPHMFSNSQDNWGYYNGKPNGPFLTFFNYTSYNIDRRVDTVLSEAGLLKKIVLPTGGSVNFFYEHNRGVPPSYASKVFFLDVNPAETVEKLDGFLKNYRYYDAANNLYSKQIIIPSTKTSAVVFNMDLPYCDPINNYDGCNYQVWLEGPNSYNALIYQPGSNTQVTLNIPSGTYVLKVLAPPGHDIANYLNSFYATLRWTETKVDNTDGTGGSIYLREGSGYSG